MIHAKPRRGASWTYDLEGPGYVAALGHRLFRGGWLELRAVEDGWLADEPARLDVRRVGVLAGRWRVVHDGEVVAKAHKPSAFAREFVLETPDGELWLEAELPYRRRFTLGLLEGDPGAVLAHLGPRGQRSEAGAIRAGRALRERVRHEARAAGDVDDDGGGHEVEDEVDPLVGLDPVTVLLAFWLVTMLWRRAGDTRDPHPD